MAGGFSLGNFDLTLKGPLEHSEKRLINGAVGVLVLILIYFGISTFLVNEMDNKIAEVTAGTQRVAQQESNMNSDRSKIDEKTSEYTELLQAIQEKSATDTENKRLKYSVPTLLNKIMYSIPTNVQLTSILNSNTKVIITAQSDKYEPLGIFVAKLSQDGILKNVVSDQSKKQNDVVVVTIEGELP